MAPPGYLFLYAAGILRGRIDLARQQLGGCQLCPKQCGDYETA